MHANGNGQRGWKAYDSIHLNYLLINMNIFELRREKIQRLKYSFHVADLFCSLCDFSLHCF